MIGVGAIAATSCSRPDRAPSDSASDTVEISATGADWVSELGDVLVVHGDSEQTGVVLVPDAPTAGQLAAASVALVRTAGDSSAPALLAAVADSQACGEAPVVRISPAGPAGWTLGLNRNLAGLRVDSIESFSSADSVAAVVAIARLASALPVDRDSKFNGLPFVVVGAYRVRLAEKTVLVGRVARRIPQEASPIEERTLVVAEQSGSGGYVPHYHLRSEGPEDSVEHYALLSAVSAGTKTFLVLERESEIGSRYEILERDVNGSWRLRWARLLAC